MASSNLFQQFLQPVRSVADYSADMERADAQRDNMEARRQQNALELLTLQQNQRKAADAEGDRNALQRIAVGWNADTTADQRVAGLRNSGRAGLMTQADALEKAEIERQKGLAAVAKDQADADKLAFGTAMERQRAIADMAGAATDQASWVRARNTARLLGADVSQIPEQYDPQTARQIAGTAMTQLQRMEQALRERQFGETQRHNQATEGLTARGQDITASTTRRGQDMVDARSREQLAQNPKPNSQASKAQDATEALRLIDQAEQVIGAATGSSLGNAIDRGAQAVGISTKGAQAAAQLKAIEGMLVAKMPKMSGPQSDKDVLLYRQMAGQIGDPTIPAETKRAALKSIREIQQRYASEQGAAPAATSRGAVPSVSNW